jgi:hypothetical protein
VTGPLPRGETGFAVFMDMLRTGLAAAMREADVAVYHGFGWNADVAVLHAGHTQSPARRGGPPKPRSVQVPTQQLSEATGSQRQPGALGFTPHPPAVEL